MPHWAPAAIVLKPLMMVKQSAVSEQLVGSAEHAPDLGQAHEAHAAADDDHDQGGDDRGAEELRSAGQVVVGLSFRSQQLAEQVAAETGRGVKGGQSEDGDRQGEEVVNRGVALLASEGSEHGGNTTGKDRGRSAQQELVAAAGRRLAPHHADGDEGDDAESGLKVPELIREWKPEQAPQATVMNRNGKSGWPAGFFQP